MNEDFGKEAALQHLLSKDVTDAVNDIIMYLRRSTFIRDDITYSYSDITTKLIPLPYEPGTKFYRIAKLPKKKDVNLELHKRPTFFALSDSVIERYYKSQMKRPGRYFVVVATALKCIRVCVAPTSDITIRIDYNPEYKFKSEYRKKFLAPNDIITMLKLPPDNDTFAIQRWVVPYVVWRFNGGRVNADILQEVGNDECILYRPAALFDIEVYTLEEFNVIRQKQQ